MDWIHEKKHMWPSWIIFDQKFRRGWCCRFRSAPKLASRQEGGGGLRTNWAVPGCIPFGKCSKYWLIWLICIIQSSCMNEFYNIRQHGHPVWVQASGWLHGIIPLWIQWHQTLSLPGLGWPKEWNGHCSCDSFRFTVYIEDLVGRLEHFLFVHTLGRIIPTD